ncbi:Gfo/Idh/MocA family protein [Bacteroidota bacterium]
MKAKKNINRREFLGTAAATAVVTVVPRHVLGGPQYVAPSDKVTIGYVGCGTQGLRVLTGFIPNPEIQIIATCDPNKSSTDYVDWSRTGIRNRIRTVLEDPSWGEGINGIPGGRDIAKEVVEKYYGKNKPSNKYKGCNAYADFRELLEKEKDLDAVKVITPDHLHATISIAAMKKGKHVVMHKPLANRLHEARLVDKTVRETGVASHLLAWRSPIDKVRNMIRDGAIGSIKEIHNWTDRPFWPHYLNIPTDKPPVPKGFDWDLWLGPVPDRPYHPHYTHAVFRGWYDFGGGCIADMGNYSLWPIFMALDLGVPESIEALPSAHSQIIDQVSKVQPNDFAFPHACQIRFKFPARGSNGPIDLYWYDGGMRPLTPPELEQDDQQMPATGTMFVGDKGKILRNQLIPEKKMLDYLGVDKIPEEERRRGDRNAEWIAAFKGGKPSAGNFQNAKDVTETINLGGVALRISRKNFKANITTPPLKWDSKNMKVTNIPEANEYLYREYREGWEL